MTIVPIAQYAPDAPDPPSDGSANVFNVLPRTPVSYGPLPGLAAFSTGSNPIARVQGAYACLDTSGNVNIIAGDATKLYRLTAGATTFSDVSKVAGYAVATDASVNMTLFGNRIITTDFTDAPQSFVLGSSTIFADMITTGLTSLKARFVAVVRDFVVFGNTTDGTFGAQPQRVHWSVLDDPTSFPTPGTSSAIAGQSDYQDLVGDFGWVKGVVGGLGTADGAIFQERGVWRMTYTGAPDIFDFSVAEGARGTPASGSLIQVGSVVYYLGEDGFYVFNGTVSQPIGVNRYDKSFFEDLDQTYFHRISGTFDPINKLVIWAYPGTGHSNGNPNRLAIYNWALDRWTTTVANDVQVEILLRMLTPGYSLDSLDALSSSIDALTLSLDSRLYTAGKAALAAFNTSHVLCSFTGSNLAPVVETTEAQLVPGRRARILNFRPHTDAGTPSVSIGTRDTPQAAVTYGTAVAMSATGDCKQRADGRFIRARITLPAGTSFTHISGGEVPDADVVPLGVR